LAVAASKVYFGNSKSWSYEKFSEFINTKFSLSKLNNQIYRASEDLIRSLYIKSLKVVQTQQKKMGEKLTCS
jgi:hypothetical protein